MRSSTPWALSMISCKHLFPRNRLRIFECSRSFLFCCLGGRLFNWSRDFISSRMKRTGKTLKLFAIFESEGHLKYAIYYGQNVYFVTMALLPVYLEDDVNVAGNPAASSNGLSAGAAVGVTVAVVAVGVAVAVVWMWHRQWVLPCASNVTMGTFYRSCWMVHWLKIRSVLCFLLEATCSIRNCPLLLKHNHLLVTS